MTDRSLLTKYLRQLSEVAGRADAREESYYPSLAALIQEVAQAAGKPHVKVTVQPRPTEAGNPDFRVWDGEGNIIGYIEAKPPEEELLDRVEDSEQLRRYRNTFPNLILTNFLEFRLYRNGERVETVLLGRPRVLTAVRAAPPAENVEQLVSLLSRFLDFSLPPKFTAESLAIELAKRTRFLRDITLQQLQVERHAPDGALLAFYEAFQKYLLGGLSEEAFADLYAQTITYGLFAARTRTANGFNRRNAFDAIPRTIGVLRDLFRYISLGELSPELEWIVDDITHVLAVADAPGILSQYYREGMGSDPVVHFYETFLAHYDPEERERRGVYYTPEAVVDYIVRTLHRLLKETFGKADGLASADVTLLDPAAGTMTFVARAAQEAVHEFESRYGGGSRAQFIRDHVLRDFFAFELMMAPYAVGHLKMAFYLEELGYHLADEERMPFYLTNTLDMGELEQSKVPGLSSLAEESHLAGRIKKETPILVILGNPPYSGHSANRSWQVQDGRKVPTWIGRLIEDYKQVDGRPLGEKNPKWLQDDYVKFLRFAEWKIAQASRGVVGIITNHSYLDNPTFRGMRQHLMLTFDEIYVLDLHGNSLKRERSPDGSPDENVFDIRQGVAIAFLVKKGREPKGDALVRHSDLWGVRKHKYDWLRDHDLRSTSWTELQPRSSSYLFVPRDRALEDLYSRNPSVTDLFQVHSVGIVTARDSLTIHWTPEEAWSTVLAFSRIEPELAREAYALGKDAQDWKITLAQEDLREAGPDRRRIVPILYRPFDVRYTYYTGRSRGFICRPRPEVMRHMLAGENVALITARSNKSPTMDHFFCSPSVVETKCGESTVQSYTFPLFLYPGRPEAAAGQHEMLAEAQVEERRSNLNPEIIARLEEAWGMTFDPTPQPPPRLRGGGAGEGSWPTPARLWERLKPLARQMRKNPTPAEERLWDRLRGKQLQGCKFRRQHAIGRFIVDFYCRGADLIIEVDGPIHEYTPEEDAIRQEFLESLGLRVLRVTSEQVVSDTESVLAAIAAALSPSVRRSRTFTPDEVFHYIYAILYSPAYREKYAEFLRRDFPRIPFTADPALFGQVAALGQRLIDLHLLRSTEVDTPLARFEGQGDCKVLRGRNGLRYDPKAERVHINSAQCFAPVPLEVWEYEVGGYQVCEKWLKDRAGRTLSLGEVRTYCRIVSALKLTIDIQQEIDALYPQAESQTIAFPDLGQANAPKRRAGRSGGRRKARG